jgi:hypothetical protein
MLRASPLLVFLPHEILNLRKEHMVVTVVDEEKREHHNVIAVLKGEPREPEHTANEEQCTERAGHIDPIKIAKVARTSA